ncbi:MAG TPA: hypothetical protein VNH53_00785 [Sphingomicrobium sp.]|nr:hypothetical protein [Sphingomicrobium sp.]
MKPLAEFVNLKGLKHRSTRIDADAANPDVLSGYVLQPSVEKALRTVADALTHSCRAFTWTGPYGTGKSTAALLLAGLIDSTSALADAAHECVPADLAEAFRSESIFRSPPESLLITAHARPLRQEIAENAGRVLKWKPAEIARASADDAALISALDRATINSGLVLIIDELGKALESSYATGGVHLLQDLAEWASRSGGRIALIGILHQSFDRYAARAGRAGREDWAKVQGRFMDIPFVAGVDEVVSLIASAVDAQPNSRDAIHRLADEVAGAVAGRRQTDRELLTTLLVSAWPLHPITTLLLGPISRRRFAQNERSIFSFLASAEPLGFQEHLAQFKSGTPADLFGPDRLWDYIVANFGLAIAAGDESHRMSIASEAIERAEARGGTLHGRIARAAAAIDFFKDGTGLALDEQSLRVSLAGEANKAVAQAIDDLVEWTVLLHQPRLGGFALFAGSDFDLDGALNVAREELTSEAFSEVPALVGFSQVSAKRHYFRTGALRTFEAAMSLISVDEAKDPNTPARLAEAIASFSGSYAGKMLLLASDGAVPDAALDALAKKVAKQVTGSGAVGAVGVASSVFVMRETAADLLAIDRVASGHAQLEGDRLARREIAARRAALIDSAYREVVRAFDRARWFVGDRTVRIITDEPISLVASRLADAAFPSAPIIQSELLQRDRPSSNAMAALRELGHAMVRCAHLADLGIDGFPPEKGLYLTILKASGLHREMNGRYRFTAPNPSTVCGRSLEPAWGVFDQTEEINLAKLYDDWAAPPYGIKRGIMPVLALARLLASRSEWAIYLDGLYQPEVDEVFFDRLLQDPSAVGARRLKREGEQVGYMNSVREGLSLPETATALETASAVFRRFAALPEYSRRTSGLSPMAVTVRDVVIRADDPEALLFADLPRIAADPSMVIGALGECEGAFGQLLNDLRGALASAVGAPADFAGVATRVEAVVGTTGDLRFDAFATRLKAFDGAEGDIEGLASLLVHKPARSWSDLDRQRAFAELFRLGRSMREAEALLNLRGKGTGVEVVAVLAEIAGGSHMARLELTPTQRREAELLADELLLILGSARGDIPLAALASAIAKLSQCEREEAA